MFLFFILASGQIFRVNPENVAKRIGQRAIISCDVRVGDDVMEWREYVTDNINGRRIYDTQSGIVVDDKYDILNTLNMSYTLIIKNTTVETAGMYECRLVNANQSLFGSILGISKCTHLYIYLKYIRDTC